MSAPAWVEVQLALGGALRLARGDRRGLGFFDTSIDGFWRSFRAAILCYPLYLLLLTFRISAAQWEASGVATVLVVETISYVISWVMFPLLILPIAGWFHRENHFLTFMVVYNWSQLPQTALLAIVGLEEASGILPSAAGHLADFACVVAVLVYEWYIARVALAVTGVQAAFVVVIDVILGGLLGRVAESLY
jgi:hypothetical protein